MPFAYVRDPLFLLATALYFANRYAVKPVWDHPFVHSYLSDCLLIPVLIPLMLWGLKITRLRRHDAPPSPVEVLVPLAIWAATFEVVLPSWKAFEGLAFADPMDIAAYCAGAVFAVWFWHVRYDTAPVFHWRRGSEDSL